MRDPDAQRVYQRIWRAKRRQEWLKLNGPCVQCGSWLDLELDHKDPAVKELQPSWLWSLAPTNPRRIAELAKCQVLCLPCHKRKTAIDNGYGTAPHGTLTRYRLKCRCVLCRTATSKHKQAWRKRTGKK